MKEELWMPSPLTAVRLLILSPNILIDVWLRKCGRDRWSMRWLCDTSHHWPWLLDPPVQIPLQSPPTLRQINPPPRSVSPANLLRVHSNPLTQTTDKDAEENWPQH